MTKLEIPLRAILCGGVALGMFAAAWPAAAQDDTDDQDDDRPIVVTASRSGEGVPADKLGASVTVIDDEALDQRQTRIVSDVLRDVPGVAVSRTGAIGSLTQIRLRGSEGNHVLVLIDGIEAADPYNGEYDFGMLIADPDARIEVLRGQQSSLYGSDAIGGVIHYMTLSGREAPGIKLRAEGGSFDTLSTAARAGGVSENVDYAVSGVWYHTGGYPTARNGTRNVGSDSIGGSAKFNFTPSDNFKLTGVLRYSHTDADTNNSESDPGSPLFGYTVDSPGVYSTNQALYGLLSAQSTALDGNWTNTLTGQFADTTRKTYAAAGFDYGSEGLRYKGSFVSSIRFGGDDITHRVTGAVDVEREQFQNTSPMWAFNGRRHTDNLGIVGQYELIAGDFSGGASVRHDRNDRFDDPTTWRIQGSYRLPSDTRIRATYASGVKNPGYYELYGYSDGVYIGNPNLQPEKSKGWEVGLEQSFADGRVTIGGTHFDATLEGEIYTTYSPPSYVATPANRTTASRQKGFELFASARPSRQIRLEAAFTSLDAEENGVEEARRPGDIASFNATYMSTDKRFSTTLTIRYNGEMVDDAYTDPSFVPVRVDMNSFVLINLNLQYEVMDGIVLFGRAENLFDADYEEAFGIATPGIGIYGGAKAKF